MNQPWDEFAKSLAQPLPRRESLRRLGLVMAATVLSPLGARFARAGKVTSDRCKAFCPCSNKRQQDQCLKACRACGSDPSRLSGSCGNYVCCGAGLTPCGSDCADLANDPDNCGACGQVCAAPGPYESGACLDGECQYTCVPGAVRCNGVCTFLDWDHDNCGACGRVCGINSACHYGECINITGEP